MPNGLTGAISTATHPPQLQSLPETTPALITTTITRAENSPEQPTSLRQIKRHCPHAMVSLPRPIQQKNQPLDLSFKPLNASALCSNIPESVPSTSGSGRPQTAPYVIEILSFPNEHPKIIEFLNIPEHERRAIYNKMVMEAMLLRIPRDDTGENISLEMRTLGQAHLMGIPVLNALVIKDITEKTLLKLESLQSAALHFLSTYAARQRAHHSWRP